MAKKDSKSVPTKGDQKRSGDVCDDPELCRKHALLPLLMLRHHVTREGPCALPESAFRLPEPPSAVIAALDQIEAWLRTCPIRPAHGFQRTLALVRIDGTLQEFTQVQGPRD